MSVIKRVTLRNFLSVGNIAQTIELNIHGMTLILGENLDITGTDNRNGVGKTSLLQAISYGLFNEPLTKIKLDNLVNNANNKGMLVIVEFESQGKNYIIERGRKPNVFKFLVDGVLNEAKGTNAVTQSDIDKIFGMTHTMFKHVIALNTYTDPFMRLKPSEQREVIEELLGITQLSQRADALKILMDETKDAVKTEEARIKANKDANERIENAITKAKEDAEEWEETHERQLDFLLTKADKLTSIDIDAELKIFDDIDAWTAQKKEFDDLIKLAQQEVDSCVSEISRIKKEIIRYRDEASRVDNGEIARLEAQAKRYLAESEEDISVQLNRLTSEKNRRLKEAETKTLSAVKIAGDREKVQSQIDNPNAHTCTTCGQGLAGTDHLAKVIGRLEAQLRDLIKQAEDALNGAETSKREADVIDTEIEQTKEKHALKKEEACSKAVAIQQDIKVAQSVLENQKSLATGRITELSTMLDAITERKQTNDAVLAEVNVATAEIGKKPISLYGNREAIFALQKDRDALLNQIEMEMSKTNVHLPKIEGLESTLAVIDYDPLNEYTLRLKHEVFLYKLLTAKDSFIRKKIVDQNLMYLNNRLNYYLEKIGLPHEVRFLPDLTVDINILGRELDFEQLSRGEMNRVILATFWSFRDVWQNLNTSVNLMFLDELLDAGLDRAGVMSAVDVLQEMSINNGTNIFLISHKDELRDTVENILTVKKEDNFTTFELQ